MARWLDAKDLWLTMNAYEQLQFAAAAAIVVLLLTILILLGAVRRRNRKIEKLKTERSDFSAKIEDLEEEIEDWEAADMQQGPGVGGVSDVSSLGVIQALLTMQQLHNQQLADQQKTNGELVRWVAQYAIEPTPMSPAAVAQHPIGSLAQYLSMRESVSPAPKNSFAGMNEEEE